MTRAVVPILGVLLALATGELLARLHGDRLCVGEPGVFMEADARFGWRHRPGLRGWATYCDDRPIPPSPIETDDLGMLESPLDATPSGAARMLVLGGVLPEGLGVRPERRLSRALQERADVRRGRPLRVFNAGTGGFALDNALLWFRAEGARLHPDVVLLVADPVTDMTAVSPALITAAASRLPWKPYLLLDGDGLRVFTPAPLQSDAPPPVRSSLLDRLQLVRLARGTAPPPGAPTGWLVADPTGSTTGDMEADRARGRDLVRAILRVLRDEVRAAGGTLVVAMAPLPRLPNLGEATPEKPLRSILIELGIPTVDLGPPLWGMRKQLGQPATIPGTTRLDAGGHFIASQVIWDFLARRRLLPDGVVPVEAPGGGRVGAWRPFPRAFAAALWADRDGLAIRLALYGLLGVSVTWIAAVLPLVVRVWLLAATGVAMLAALVDPQLAAAALVFAVAFYAAVEWLRGRLGAIAIALLIALAIAAAARWLVAARPIEPGVRLFGAFATSMIVLRLVAYAVDRRRGVPHPTPGRFLAAFFFFPTFGFGPIESPAALAPRLVPAADGVGRFIARSAAALVRVAGGALLVGASIHLFGLVTPDVAASRGAVFGRSRLWLWVVEALLQLSLFQAGWTTIARGLAAMIGVDVPPNFRAPWAARDPRDFWRRWYATLGAWLEAYVAQPLRARGRSPRLALGASVAIGAAWYGWVIVKLYGLGGSPQKLVGGLAAFAAAQVVLLAAPIRGLPGRLAALVGVPLGFIPLVLLPWGGVRACLGIVRRLVLPLAVVACIARGAWAEEATRTVDLARQVDCTGATDATAVVARALEGPSGRTLVVPAGCRVLVSGPAPGGATFTLPSGTTIRCDDHDAGFVLAQRRCVGGPTPGAACDRDAGCADGGRCVTAGKAPFAPDASATYTLLRAAEHATDAAVVGCGVFVNQIEPFARCVGGAHDGRPCEAAHGCGDGGTCTGSPRAPSGDGRIVVVDLTPAASGTIDDVWVSDHLRGVSFRGGRRIEHSRNDLRGPADTAAAAFTRYELDGIEVGNGATVRGNRIIASGRAIAALGSFVTVAENRVGEARGVYVEHADPAIGVYLDGGQSIVTHNHVTAFNCVRGSTATSNVTVAGNRCFGGAGSKIVVAGAGWTVTGNYFAWGSGDAVCVGGAARAGRCTANTDCPGGLCARGAPVIAIGDDGTPGWTAGGSVGGADHPVIADNLVFSNVVDTPLVAFADPGRRCAAGAGAGRACRAPEDCACEGAGDCGRGGECTAGRCRNPLACDRAHHLYGSITGNLLFGGAAGPRVGVDLARIGPDTQVFGWQIASNHFQGQAIGIRLPDGAGAASVEALHVLPNAFTMVSRRIAGWDPRMGDVEAALLEPPGDAVRTVPLTNRTGAPSIPGDVVAAAKDTDAAFTLARAGDTALGVVIDEAAPDASARIALVGTTTCNLDPAARITRGDRLTPDTTPGKSTKAISGVSAFAIALTNQSNTPQVRCLVGAAGLTR
ncbi:MAG TPA: hypothetical protein VMS22_26280 [Candidatus Eisenbacteria bacterium]|nr:hypothetical protein [Candidatus Eisenbacteria bacterium]